MSNNMIEANKKLFEPILNEVENHGSVHDKHCLILDEEKDFFENLIQKKVVPILYDINAILLEKDNNYYLVINNITVNIYDSQDNDFIEVCEDYNRAIFLLLGAKGLLKFNKHESFTIYDSLLYKTDNIQNDDFEYFSTGARKHSFASLESSFEGFKVFKVKNNEFFFDREVNFYKLLSFILIDSNNMRKLPFEEKTLIQFNEISIGIGKNFFIPYEFIMESLIAIKWKHVFKDLYRCVENLYAFPKAKKLIDDMNCSESIEIEDIIISLESQLGWRPIEQQALQELLKFATPIVLNEFLKVFTDDSSWSTQEELKMKKIEEAISDTLEIEKLDKEIDQKKAEYIAKSLYKLRNSLVHFRKALDTDSSNFDDTEWNILTRGMLMFIVEIYDEMYK